MKKIFYLSLLLLLFVSGWVIGFSSSVYLLYWRPPLPAPVRNSDLTCTCAPCLPDLWCKKCGHKSRDCPRLSWYFRRQHSLTNGTKFVFTNFIEGALK